MQPLVPRPGSTERAYVASPNPLTARKRANRPNPAHLSKPRIGP